MPVITGLAGTPLDTSAGAVVGGVGDEVGGGGATGVVGGSVEGVEGTEGAGGAARCVVPPPHAATRIVVATRAPKRRLRPSISVTVALLTYPGTAYFGDD